MDKISLLKSIANTAYNVGFGAKKHFATFDIIEKIPNWIGFLTMSIGILQIAYPTFCYNKEVSIFLIVIGIQTLYLMSYASCKDKYDEVAVELTNIFNNLRDLYFSIKNSTNADCEKGYEKLKQLEEKYYSISISKQVFFSDWYAHYKFFYQMQIDWIDEEKKFSFIKDKVPKSFIFFIIIIITIAVILISIY